MSKSELLMKTLPDKYKDCSAWFQEEGLDVVPSLLDFIESGRSKEEHDKFRQLHTIECMKRYCAEAGEDENKEEAGALIEREIQKYNEM